MKKRKIAFLSCIAILTVSTVSYASFIIDEKSSINSINVSAGDVTISNKFVNNYPMYFYLNSNNTGSVEYNQVSSTDNDKFLFDIVSYNPGTPLISATGNYDGGNLISIDYCLKFYLNVNALIKGNIYAYEFLDELECIEYGYNVKFNRSKYYFVEFAISFDEKYVSDFTEKIDATNCYISCPGISSIIGENTTDSSQLALKNHRIYPFNPIVLADSNSGTYSENKYSESTNSASMKFAYRSDPTVNFLDPNYFFYFVKQLEDYGFFESPNLDLVKLERLEFEAHFIVNVDANYANWAYNPKFTIQFTDYLEQKKTTGGNS